MSNFEDVISMFFDFRRVPISSTEAFLFDLQS